MINGINRSITGFTLSTALAIGSSFPVAAQQVQAISASTQKPAAPQLNDGYTIGGGDLVRVDSFDTPELVLEPRYTVLPDGTINLPWVGGVSIKGLSLKEAAQKLTTQYSRFIRNPVITVSLVAPRPLKVGVIGEVNRPGSYIISVLSNETTTSSLTQRTGGGGDGGVANQWPTLIKAIQTAGGITQGANVRQIQVRRLDGNTETTIDIDLWKFLQSGDISQDISLKDGDTVIVPKATTLDAAEITQVAASNFSPETIRVNVVGEVVTPGAVAIRPNSTLNQGILAAGGFRPGRAKKTVELIRLNPDGSVTRRSIKIDLSKGLDDASNPALRNNDVVVVNRTFIAGVTDTVGGTIGPFLGLLGIGQLFQ
jgi:polysaccharide export outer membrane protein